MAPPKQRGAGGSADEWFARHEEELLRQARRERQRKEEQEAAAAKQKLREAHWMKCPKCGHDLQEIAVDTVRVDRCTSCEGIFLDRGELEEIMLKRSEERRGFFRNLLGFGSG